MPIDLHIHLLPGIDDGARNAAMSASMLDRLANNGVTRVIATPHLMEPLTPEYYREALESLEVVRPLAEARGITVELGFEHMLASDTAARLVAGEPSTLAGSKSVLVELPFSNWPANTGQALHDLRAEGYRCILAHPERYAAVHDRLDMIVDVALQGAVPQLTGGSFVGVYGKDVSRLVRQLLDDALARDYPIVLASDAHSDGSRLVLAHQGHEWIAQHVPHGKLVVEWASDHVPTTLLADGTPLGFNAWLAQQDPARIQESLGPPLEKPRGLGKLFKRIGR